MYGELPEEVGALPGGATPGDRAQAAQRFRSW